MLRDQHDLVLTDRSANGEVQALDLIDFSAVRDAVAGMDAIVHLAIASHRALAHLDEHGRDEEEMQVNVLGTQHVFEAARLAGMKRIVFMSSMTTVLGEPLYDRIERDTPPRPRNLYACTKLFGEHLAELYTRTHDIAIICIRLGQPVPIPDCEYGSEHVRQFASDGVFCDMADLAQGVHCALTASNVKFKVINLVSASPEGRVDLSAAAEIGYRPTRLFTREGDCVENPR